MQAEQWQDTYLNHRILLTLNLHIDRRDRNIGDPIRQGRLVRVVRSSGAPSSSHGRETDDMLVRYPAAVCEDQAVSPFPLPELPRHLGDGLW